ncbi:inovirus Gp2 family protein [Chitinimonas taiwanensis]|uniref:inovirus Gp2 family protein n=1 Tax=Chitinimonas taiwanensis TaxID=240412 RepID=UPI0035AF7062
MLRHPINANLSLHNESAYNGFPIQESKGPFIREYLGRLQQTIDRALMEHPRTFAFRVDLRLPVMDDILHRSHSNELLDRFMESFKAKIRHNRSLAKQKNASAHDSAVRYVWTKEHGQHGSPHYHLLFLLNHDAYNTLGSFSVGKSNLFNRIQEAWASALSLPVDAVQGLVEIPNNPTYRVFSNDLNSQAELFYRASYLCKMATKEYGDGTHAFGCSRI